MMTVMRIYGGSNGAKFIFGPKAYRTWAAAGGCRQSGEESAALARSASGRKRIRRPQSTAARACRQLFLEDLGWDGP
ncbi:hypothetical protein HPB52_007137 [Rhipicephalus sanguineus]|uniref:Uncharacterized protein n=1 Tax=Rhipicephalus sanguineus TaxID=34632 RepID=A0A9D4SW49_RHISA|nr:hypothetical protein HPB52_007137 [Rhipicephalus sanguineus]